jgi:uncharacterized protein (DUF1501 family)
VQRRKFIQLISAFSTLGLLPQARVWAAATTEAKHAKKLLVVFLRGAVDGLSVVAPYAEPEYSTGRKRIVLAPPGRDGGLIDLDGHFGLHPALAPLADLWREKSLAFVHACGSPDASRSHFDAQDYMESGTPGHKTTADGWMNRLLSVLPGGTENPVAAVNFGPTVPRVLAGKNPVANVDLPGRGKRQAKPLDRPQVRATFDRLYGGKDALSRAYQQSQQARERLTADEPPDMEGAGRGAPPAQSLASNAARAAQILSKQAGTQLGFLALGGWDTHVNQGAAQGQLANRLRPLGEGLASLVRGLGKSYADTVIVVMSEFGRTVNENGNAGTDHGHGNVMWVLGGPVRGGQVYGDWPGLARDKLFEGRDLAVTTDFRSAIGTVLSGHFGLGASARNRVFPNLPEEPSSLKALLA